MIVESTTTFTTSTETATANSVGGGAKRDAKGDNLLARDTERRQASTIPTNIPGYASACSGAGQYSSACSCVGAKPTFVTVPAPTTHITITIVSCSYLTREHSHINVSVKEGLILEQIQTATAISSTFTTAFFTQTTSTTFTQQNHIKF